MMAGTYSDPALILPGAVGQTELDATAKKDVASGVAGLNSNTEIEDLDVMTQKYLSITMVIG